MKLRSILQIVLILFACNAGFSQSLDWMNDITVFGSAADERLPAIAIMANSGEIRVLCTRGDSLVSGKLSLDAGSHWSIAADLPVPGATRPCACADDEFAYVLLWSPGSGDRILYRFPPRGNDWGAAAQVSVVPDRTQPVYSVCMATDYEFQPDDPYLNVCWMENNIQTGQVAGWFVQSRDRGSTVRQETRVFEGRVLELDDAQVSMAAAWVEDQERILVATSLDRPGSVPHQIRLFVSEDQGGIWNEGFIVDGTSADQSAAAIAAFEDIVLLSYVQRTAAGEPGDVMLSYSLDAGATFTPPIAVAGTALDEYSPHVAISGAEGRFWITYLAGEVNSDSATVYVREGFLQIPGELGPAIMLSGEIAAVRHGGMAISSGPLGAAAAWTARFPLGDTDVCFDASWRTARISDSPPSIARSMEWRVYPNP
ncbi:hypothetical protein KJ815_03670, partial [bacterium]|nr:hypothetical protein [bacterium]